LKLTEFMLEDIEAVWPEFEQRALRSESSDEALRYAREKCRRGEAVCIANSDGVIVLTLRMVRGARIRAVVLLAVSTGRAGAFKRHEQAVVEIARSLEADELGFETDRVPAWRRVVGPDWTERDGSFSRSV
jgi:hypothetical protein